VPDAGSLRNVLPDPERPPAERLCLALLEGLHEVVGRVQSAVGGFSDGETLRRIVVDHLVFRLTPLVAPVLVAELQAAADKGGLSGGNGEERFESFVRSLRRPGELRELLVGYPALLHTVQCIADLHEAFLVELLQRLQADVRDLASTIGAVGGRGLQLKDIQMVGDHHQGGRCVALLTLDGPDGPLRCLYKPRSLDADRAFGRLLGYLSPELSEDFFLPALLPREGYGWCSYVPTKDCSGPDEVAVFYRRLGCLTAVLHLLLARDLHAENLIAHGAYPVFVDLESLVPPAPPMRPSPRTSPKAHLLVSLLLPQRCPAAGGFVDQTALGGIEGPGGPLRRTWRDGGTDRMRPVWRVAPADATGNRPTLLDGPVEPLDYEADFTSGFSDAFDVIARHRKELATPGSPLWIFSRTSSRVVLRSTAQYGLLLERSYSARMWGDPQARRRLFENLFQDTSGTGVYPRIAAAEQADLARCDKPIFLAQCDERAIRSSRGRRVPLEVPRSGFDRVLDHLRESFHAGGLSLQQTVIRQSFEARRRVLRSGGTHTGPRPETHTSAVRDGGGASPVDLRQWVELRLDRLLELRLGEGSCTAWPTLLPDRQVGWQPALTGLDLHGGVAGIAWLLAWAGVCLEREDYLSVSLDGFRRLDTALEAPEPGKTRGGPGLFYGSAGIVYALSHGWYLTGERWMRSAIDAWVDETVARCGACRSLDLAYGLAGALVGLQHVTDLAAHTGLGAVMDELAAQLCQALDVGDGPPGLASGRAGIALALSRSGRPPAEVEYERPEVTKADWWEGRAGLAAAALVGSSPETARALMTRGLVLGRRIPTLAGGDAGPLDVLLEIARSSGEPKPWSVVTDDWLGPFSTAGVRLVPSGRPPEIFVPGLLEGEAGMVYQVLRVLFPFRVPCLLTFAPPSEPPAQLDDPLNSRA